MEAPEYASRRILQSQAARILHVPVDDVHFAVSNSEIISSINYARRLDDSDSNLENGHGNSARGSSTPLTVIVGVSEGMHLKRLAHLSNLARDIADGNVPLNEKMITASLDSIGALENPYNQVIELLGWMVVGTGLPIIFGGSWWDSLLATIGATIAFTALQLTASFAPKYVNSWGLALAAFIPAIVISAVDLFREDINFVIALLSSIAVPLPGYTVSIGLAELAANRVIRGIGHMAAGLVTLFWLVLGGFLGESLVFAIANNSSQQDYTPNPINQLWLILFIPLIAVSLNVGFQIAYSDFLPAFTVSVLSYVISVGANYIATTNISTFLSAMICTALANVWCIHSDRSQPIVLTPAIVFLVSGSIGFRGILEIVSNGDKEEGMEQFAQMFTVALVISVGVLAGNTLVFPKTTL